MAIAKSAVTAVSLDQGADVLGIHPAIFNGCFSNHIPVYTTTSNNEPQRAMIHQRNWQNYDSLGREAFALAMQEAEALMEDALSCSLRPRTFVERYFRPDLYERQNGSLMDTSSAERKTLKLYHGSFVTGGVEKTETVSTGATVTYSDPDNDTLKECWTVGPIATTAESAEEIEVYFSAGDRWPTNAATDETWRIRPVQVELSGGNVTIRGDRWQMVKPSLHFKLSPTAIQWIEADDDANFVTTVDVIRRYVDTDDNHVTITWNDSTRSTQTGFLEQWGHNEVMVYAGSHDGSDWNEEGLSYTTPPLHIEVQYRAGLPLDAYGNVPTDLAKAVTGFACGFLADGFGGDLPVETQIRHMQQDLQQLGGGKLARLPYSKEDYDNPFGTWRGAMDAWRYVVRKLKEFQQYGR